MFGDVLVNELFRTKFIFFNAGKEPILGSDDVVKPITLFLDNAQILQEPLVHPSNNEIVFTAKRVNDRVEINFKYLDHQDGAIIETLHTKSERLDCQGKIIGASKVSYLGRFQQISLTTSDKVMAGLFITCIVTLAITVVLGFRGSLAPNSPLMVISVALGLVSGSGIPPIINFFLSKRFPSWSRQFAPLKDPSQREIKDR